MHGIWRTREPDAPAAPRMSSESVACVLSAAKVSRMCPRRGVLQCHVSMRTRDTSGYESADHGATRVRFDNAQAFAGARCCIDDIGLE
jgi:hypothetical protein